MDPGFSLGVDLGFLGEVGDILGGWGCSQGLSERVRGSRFDSEVSTREVAGKGYALGFWSVMSWYDYLA